MCGFRVCVESVCSMEWNRCVEDGWMCSKVMSSERGGTVKGIRMGSQLQFIFIAQMPLHR